MNYYLKRRILFLAFLSFCVILQAQREEKRISGHVRDSQDLPLAGVNIKVKNTPYGAISNEKGVFYVIKHYTLEFWPNTFNCLTYSSLTGDNFAFFNVT